MPLEEGKVLSITLALLLVNDVPLSPAHLAQKPFCHSNSYPPSPTSQPLVSQPGTIVPAYNPNPSGEGGEHRQLAPLDDTGLVLKRTVKKSN